MTQFDPEAFGQRLTEALTERGWDVKTLQESLREETDTAPGTSYGSVWSYVRGKAPQDPRQEVVEAMGRLLSRTPRYLLYGVGPKNSDEEAEQVAEGPRPGAAYLDDLEEGVARGFGAGADRVLAPGVRRSTIVHTHGRMRDSARAAARFYAGEGRETAEPLGQALRAPLDTLGVDPADLTDSEVTEYVTGVCSALRALHTSPWPKRKSVRTEGQKRLTVAPSPPYPEDTDE